MTDPSPLPTPIPLPDELREMREAFEAGYSAGEDDGFRGERGRKMLGVDRCWQEYAATLTATKPSGQVDPDHQHLAALHEFQHSHTCFVTPRPGGSIIEWAAAELNETRRLWKELQTANGSLRMDLNRLDRERSQAWQAARSATKPSGQVERLQQALRSIAEGNLGDAPWQANYDRIREVALAALSTQVQTVGGEIEGVGVAASPPLMQGFAPEPVPVSASGAIANAGHRE